MLSLHSIDDYESDKIPIDPFWNTGEQRELKIHRIHAYPAKFPAFITIKALEFWGESHSRAPERIADIFCGCGTTAYEAQRNSIPFWGCDINPVATLIARTKSQHYSPDRLRDYFTKIMRFLEVAPEKNYFKNASDRLRYWFSQKQYNDLARLKEAIESNAPSSDERYRDFFFCAFSNILKPSSRWLTKSIKPQIDPIKKEIAVIESFKKQFEMMLTAYQQTALPQNINPTIRTGSFLSTSWRIPPIDMIVTSPPYVTSYEYADLHQLSSLWLGYTTDYRELRKGTIGSLYHGEHPKIPFHDLNKTGSQIVSSLQRMHVPKKNSVAKYFLDMQETSRKAFSILNSGGIALFVIGNTEYKSVRIDNAKHLAESLLDSGFKTIEISKRKIQNKILTPYRDKHGKFTSNSNGRHVYSEEFIVIGRKEA